MAKHKDNEKCVLLVSTVVVLVNSFNKKKVITYHNQGFVQKIKKSLLHLKVNLIFFNVWFNLNATTSKYLNI